MRVIMPYLHLMLQRLDRAVNTKDWGRVMLAIEVSFHFFLCQRTIRDRCPAAMKWKIATFPYVSL